MCDEAERRGALVESCVCGVIICGLCVWVRQLGFRHSRCMCASCWHVCIRLLSSIIHCVLWVSSPGSCFSLASTGLIM